MNAIGIDIVDSASLSDLSIVMTVLGPRASLTGTSSQNTSAGLTHITPERAWKCRREAMSQASSESCLPASFSSPSRWSRYWVPSQGWETVGGIRVPQQVRHLPPWVQPNFSRHSRHKHDKIISIPDRSETNIVHGHTYDKKITRYDLAAPPGRSASEYCPPHLIIARNIEKRDSDCRTCSSCAWSHLRIVHQECDGYCIMHKMAWQNWNLSRITNCSQNKEVMVSPFRMSVGLIERPCHLAPKISRPCLLLCNPVWYRQISWTNGGSNASHFPWEDMEGRLHEKPNVSTK